MTTHFYFMSYQSGNKYTENYVKNIFLNVNKFWNNESLITKQPYIR